MPSLEAAPKTQLPPPTHNVSELLARQRLYLELIINGYSTQTVVPVRLEGGHYAVPKSALVKLDVRLLVDGVDVLASAKQASPVAQSTTLNLNDVEGGWQSFQNLPEVAVHYDGQKQQLLLTLPTQWLPEQMFGRDYWYQRKPAQSSTGALFNYDVYSAMPAEGARTTSFWHEIRLFGSTGVFSTTGLYRRSSHVDAGNEQATQYQRYDTLWQYDDEERASTYRLGDIHTGAKVSWGSGVRMGGLQVARQFGIRPDLVTYPLPQFAGEVAVPSTVDVFINGLKTNSNEVPPGPFVINSMPFINGKGEAVVVTQDALGRQVRTALPFYVSGDLLKQGLFDYSFSLGKLRRDYGIKNADYGELAVAGDVRYGLANWMTIEARGEAVSGLNLYGAGVITKLAQLGVLNVAYTRSEGAAERQSNDVAKEKNRGYEWTAGYQYTQPHFGFGVTHVVRAEDYLDLARYQHSGLASVTTKRSTVAHVNVSGQNSGSFGLGYFNLKQHDGSESRLVNLSWAPVMPPYMQGMTLSLSGNRDLEQKKWSSMVQLSIPLGGQRGYVNSGYEYNSDARASTYVNYSLPMPTEGGVGVDLAYKRTPQGRHYQQAQISHRNRYINAEVGVSQQEGTDKWLGASGSLVWLNKGLYASNRLGQSFALIDTHGISAIPVRYENSLVGVTNRSGHLFVPNVTPYFGTHFAIDPLDLPVNYQAPVIERNISVKAGTGIVLDFPITPMKSANVSLKMPSGVPVATGALAYREGHAAVYVGWDGMAYLENIDADNQLSVTLPDGQTCRAAFTADPSMANVPMNIDVPCHFYKE